MFGVSKAKGPRIHDRRLSTLQETTPKKDDRPFPPAAGHPSNPNAQPTREGAEKATTDDTSNASNEAKGGQKGTEEKQEETTDIGSHYQPNKEWKSGIKVAQIDDALRDTSALDVLTKINKKDQENGGAQGGDSAGSGSAGETKEKETVLPAPDAGISPTLANLFHNFDTYVMVKQLQEGGYTYGQSKTVMKAVRSLLAVNLDKARDSMVTKSMSENESYLFHAACSELKTEIESARRAALEKTLIDRAQIQHDYDLLEQKLSEDLLNLKDEVTSLFNDRKMVTRQEQRAMEVKIQELNYKLTIVLNGDLKSEIEALRWTTTRRGLIAIAMIAVLVVTLIRYTSVQSHATKKEASSDAKEAKAKDTMHLVADAGLIASLSSSPSSSTTRREAPDGSDGGEGGGSFVSLG